MLHYHSSPKKTQITGLNDYRPKVIGETGVGPPEGHHWTLDGSPSVCLQSKQVDDAVNMGLPHFDLCKDLICGLQLGLKYHHA